MARALVPLTFYMPALRNTSSPRWTRFVNRNLKKVEKTHRNHHCKDHCSAPHVDNNIYIYTKACDGSLYPASKYLRCVLEQWRVMLSVPCQCHVGRYTDQRMHFCRWGAASSHKQSPVKNKTYEWNSHQIRTHFGFIMDCVVLHCLWWCLGSSYIGAVGLFLYARNAIAIALHLGNRSPNPKQSAPRYRISGRTSLTSISLYVNAPLRCRPSPAGIVCWCPFLLLFSHCCVYEYGCVLYVCEKWWRSHLVCTFSVHFYLHDRKYKADSSLSSYQHNYLLQHLSTHTDTNTQTLLTRTNRMCFVRIMDFSVMLCKIPVYFAKQHIIQVYIRVYICTTYNVHQTNCLR